MTIYQAMRAAGVETASHETDLYVPVCTASIAILAKYPQHKANATRFTEHKDGSAWYDIPFGFDPAWDELSRN